MTSFLQYTLAGLALGSVYALVALGFVIIHKATNVLNFAHGAFLVVGAYVTARVGSQYGFATGVVAGIGATVVLSVLTERLLIARMPTDAYIPATIMTLGVQLVLITATTTLIGTRILPIGDPWGSRIVRLGEFSVPLSRLAALLTAALIIGGLFLILKWSSWGLAFQAATEKPEVAVLMGINLKRLAVVAWAIAGFLAAVAGVFLATFPSPGVHAELWIVAIRAFPAAIIGGINSTEGAIVGGLMVGVAESLTLGYQSDLLFLGRGAHEVVTYALMLLVLVIKPAGLFGKTEVARA